MSLTPRVTDEEEDIQRSAHVGELESWRAGLHSPGREVLLLAFSARTCTNDGKP